MKFGLSQKFVIIIEAAIVLVAISIGTASYVVVRNALIQRVDAQLQSISVLKEQSIKTLISLATVQVEGFIHAKDPREKITSYLKSGSDSDKAAILDELSYFGTANIFSSTFLIDKNGNVLVSTIPSDEGKIKSEDPYFIAAQEKTVVQSFFYDTSIQVPTMLIASPVKDQSGNFLGMVVGRINTEQISNLMIQRSGLGATGETFLVNANNLVVTDLLKSPGEELKKTIFLSEVTTCLSGKSAFGQATDYHGDSVLEYLSWVPDIHSCLVTKIDSVEVLASIIQALVPLLTIIVAVGGIMGALGYIIVKKIVRPIGKLRDSAYLIKEGNFDVRVEVSSKDEVGDLAAAFNDMTGKLRGYYGELENKVKERTSQLDTEVKKAELQNKTLENNKRAMLNLLEDARSLEEKLKEEKAGVEIKIASRTADLVRQQATLSASIEAIMRAYVLLDTSGNVILMNNRVTEFFGSTDGAWTVSKIQEKLGPTVDLPALITHAVQEKKTTTVDEILVGTKYFDIYVTPVFLKEEMLIGALLLIGDITDAKVLARSRDEFFSIASHELRTPLTAIRGNTSMILDNYADKLTDPDLKEMITDVHDSSIRLIDIVNDFLETSRLEQGRMEFKNAPFDLTELIDKALKEYQVTGSRSHITLTFATPEQPLPLVFADADRVRQVLVNLIGNGMKFTENGAVTVSARVTGELVAVMVSDSGRGISIKSQSLLFHKFQQAGDSLFTRDTTKGTGLGLYISKLMIEGMGGKIWLLSSEPGKGSTFAFTLPVAPLAK